MTSFPVPLDNLIAFVGELHPQGSPLDNLTDAVTLSAQLDEQADALLGHFVDQARRSGASWTQIGASLGVSKQAVRKRFVPRWDGTDGIPEGQLYSRLTLRARTTLVAAGRIADQNGAELTGAAHLVAGLLTEPGGLAAKIIHNAGLSDGQICGALGLAPGLIPAEGKAPASAAALEELQFTDDGQAALRDTLTAALGLGHNYIGTEHLLLGTLMAGGPAAQALDPLGLSVKTVRTALAAELDKIQAARHGA